MLRCQSIRRRKSCVIHTVFIQHTIVAEVMTKDNLTPDNEQMMKSVVEVADYNYNIMSVTLSGFTDLSAVVCS